MTVRLLPRLTPLGVSHVLESTSGISLTAASARAVLQDRSAMLSFAASGGSRDEAFSNMIGDEIRKIATTCQFPENASQVAKSKFDRLVAIYLATLSGLSTGEALRNDVWAYLTTVELPDVVVWRFSGRNSDRFEGGYRNALQRLWMRGTTLDLGSGISEPERWSLLGALTEDAAVQIFERPSIGGNRRLALALARCWREMAVRIGRNAMEPVMRRATILVRLRNEIIALSALDDHELNASVTDCFERAVALVR